MKGKQLTEKQKAFADKYIETGNATEAYKSAYSTGKMSDQVIYNEASKTVRKPLVKDYIDKRMKELEDTKIPKQKEILMFLGGVMRGTEKETVMTDDGLMKVPPAIKQRISAAKELLKRYPSDPMTKAQLRKVVADAALAEEKVKVAKQMTNEDNKVLNDVLDNLEKGVLENGHVD